MMLFKSFRQQRYIILEFSHQTSIWSGCELFVDELRVIIDILKVLFTTTSRGLILHWSKKSIIKQTAQAILDARALYPEASLADLYDELTMPPELRKAHQANDRAVMQAYGFSVKGMSEADCVAELMKMYQQLANQQTK